MKNFFTNYVTDKSQTKGGRFDRKRFRNVRRRIPFRESIDPKRIKAELAHGVLTITVPKKRARSESGEPVSVTVASERQES